MMGFLSYCIVLIFLVPCSSLPPSFRRNSRLTIHQKLFTQNWKDSSGEIKRVEDQVSDEVISKIKELESALTNCLEDSRDSNSGKIPRPPSIPPPLAKLGIRRLEDCLEGEKSLHNVEKALRNLRQRLKLEEEYLQKAEEALQKSLQEEEVLKRAEMVLSESKKAAEKRKAEALRRAKAAVKSTEKARNDENDAKEKAEQIEQNLRARRTTVSIMPLPTQGEQIEPGLVTSKAPGIPVLFDWTQDINGSITGRVKGSEIFADGDAVSTSPVSRGAQAGSIVTTSAGSKYYLHESGDNNEESVPSLEAAAPKSPNPSQTFLTYPAGVPSIENWELLDDGGVSGRLFGSSIAADGDYIETSPIAAGSIESGSVVRTSSGNQYILSGECRDKATSDDNALMGTITLAKKIAYETPGNVAEPKLENKKARSTFSLANLGSIFKPLRQRNVKAAPRGIPTLSGWSISNDGTITGVVTGSKNIQDGDLITTSPIVQGDRKKYETVTTISGSLYFLG